MTARRAAPSPCKRAKPFMLGLIRWCASRGRRRAPLETDTFVSDLSPCRSHIRPGLRQTSGAALATASRFSLAAASVFSSVILVSPSSAGCSSAATTAPVSRSTACSGL